MKKDDMVVELVRRIRYNADQRDYYKSREEDSKNPAMWCELRTWYEGRVSAFNIALMMIDPSHPMVDK
jgi:hypothetical protein